ncbi:M23 family metallopeptidase [Luteococcus sp. H138]|uniref:M23 family metallopeptidase n=1 Tax=unclassified Luteococcus TaxID=2639923 RepID=UPI00313D5686
MLDPSKCSASSDYWKGNRRFYVTRAEEHGCFTSPWFDGTHPVMLSFGHSDAPWYAKTGSHHGIDIDLPVGTPVRSAISGTVRVRPASLGTVYGVKALLLRSDGHDIVLGHLSSVVVQDGQRVGPGDLLGHSGMSGVEDMDGPHLHFEVRPVGGTYRSALHPWSFLRAQRS